MARLYFFISVETCAVFPASNMVLTFHAPMVVVTPVERMIFGRGASRCFWLSPPCVINHADEGPYTLRGGISWFTLVCVSVTGIVLWGGVVSPTPNPQPGGPGVAFSRTSTLKPARLGKTCHVYKHRRYSLQGHGSTQASPPRQGNNTEGKVAPLGRNYLRTDIAVPIKLSRRALYDDGQMINRNVINHVTKELLGRIRFQQIWLPLESQNDSVLEDIDSAFILKEEQ